MTRHPTGYEAGEESEAAYSQRNLPTWIIGSALRPARDSADLMQVWPARNRSRWLLVEGATNFEAQLSVASCSGSLTSISFASKWRTLITQFGSRGTRADGTRSSAAVMI